MEPGQRAQRSAQGGERSPRPVELLDSYGRVHRDLRVSVTDRCNFRCTYCMPEEGMSWLPRTEVLTYEEIERVARVCVERFGFESVRLTGGEPTVRAHLPVLVERLAALRTWSGHAVDLSMTTNGTTLGLLAGDLARTGLRRVNVSLDTLRRDRFLELTRRDGLDRVIDGIDAAIAAGLSPVKVNTVVMRGVNDDEIVELAAFGRDRGVTLRFIEWMPLDADQQWRSEAVVSQDEIVSRIDTVFPVEPVERGHQPAERFVYRDGQGEVGVIPSVTRPFCGTCDRLRLTADGQLRSCLFATDEVDVRSILRGPGSDRSGGGEDVDAVDDRHGAGRDDELAAAVERCVAGKAAGHMIGQATFVRPRRSMSQIGG